MKWLHHIGPSGNTAYMSRQQINKMTCAPCGALDQPGRLQFYYLFSKAIETVPI